MKIVHVINFFLPDIVAGTENYVYQLAKAQLAAGDDVYVVRPNYSHQQSYNYNGIKVVYYNEQTFATKDQVLGFSPTPGVKNFSDKIKMLSPDIVHFHELNKSNGISIFHIKSVKALDIKAVVTFHLGNYTCQTGTFMFKGQERCDGKIDPLRCSECIISSRVTNSFMANSLSIVNKSLYKTKLNLYGKNKLSTALTYPYQIEKKESDLKEVFKYADKVIVIARWFEKVLLINNFPENKLEYIKQALPEQNKYEVEENRASDDLTKLVYIGRISQGKGLHTLLKALSYIKDQKLSLHIYGKVADKDYYKKCENLIKGLQHTVEWKGTFVSTDSVSILKKYGLLVIPSQSSEMSPLLIQEGLSAKIPMIVSDVEGNAEHIVPDVNGFLFKAGDPKDLAGKINNILFNSDMKKNLQLENFVPFTFTDVYAKTSTIYKEILSHEPALETQL